MTYHGNQFWYLFPRKCGLMLICLISCLLLPVSAVAQEQAEAKLAELQAELKARQATLAANKANADELVYALRQSELEIAEVARALNITSQALDDNRDQQKKLTAEQLELKKAIIQQQEALAGQLKSAFMAGNFDYAKMLFYQDEASTFERVLTYYQYLSKYRRYRI